MIFPSPRIHSPKIWAGLKVGLLGGSFNPAHAGHRHISLETLKRLELDAIWWMVSPQNPLKSTHDMAPQIDRLSSAIKISDHPCIIATDIENELNTRYTAETLCLLKKNFSQTYFVWLMGTDNMHSFHHWEKWREIANICPIAILDRPPAPLSVKTTKAFKNLERYKVKESQAKYLATYKAPAWTLLHIPLNNLSATQIRKSEK